MLDILFYKINYIRKDTIFADRYLHSPNEPLKKGVYCLHNFISPYIHVSPIYIVYLYKWSKWKFVKLLFSIRTKFDVNLCIFNEAKSFNEIIHAK